MITATTPLAMALSLSILILGPVRALWVLFASMALGSSAALILPGGAMLNLTDACILTLWLAVLASPTRLQDTVAICLPGAPGFPLLALLSLAALLTAFMPRLMEGTTHIYAIGQMNGRAANILVPMTSLPVHATQLARLLLSPSLFLICLGLFRWRSDPRAVFKAITLATVAHLALSGAALIGADWLLDLLRTAPYRILDNQSLAGMRRLAGVFPEPSSFGLFTIGLFGIWLRLSLSPLRFVWAPVMTVALAALCLRSLSSSTLAALAIVTPGILLWQLALSRHGTAGRVAIMAAALFPMAAALGCLAWTPAMHAILDQAVFDKLSTASGQERIRFNVQALRLFVDSYGLGAGVGSVRASGWLLSTLGSLGPIGAALYLWIILRTLFLRPDRRHGPARETELAAALQCGAAAILVQACLAKPYPDLGAPAFAMLGLATALLSHRSPRQRPRSLHPQHRV